MFIPGGSLPGVRMSIGRGSDLCQISTQRTRKFNGAERQKHWPASPPVDLTSESTHDPMFVHTPGRRLGLGSRRDVRGFERLPTTRPNPCTRRHARWQWRESARSFGRTTDGAEAHPRWGFDRSMIGERDVIRVKKVAAPLPCADKGEVGASFRWEGPFRPADYVQAEEAADLNACQSLRPGTRYEIRARRTRYGVIHGVAWYRHPSMDEGTWPRQPRRDLPADIEWAIVLDQKTTPSEQHRP